jgi:hypothetical protein
MSNSFEQPPPPLPVGCVAALGGGSRRRFEGGGAMGVAIVTAVSVIPGTAIGLVAGFVLDRRRKSRAVSPLRA